MLLNISSLPRCIVRIMQDQAKIASFLLNDISSELESMNFSKSEPQIRYTCLTS